MGRCRRCQDRFIEASFDDFGSSRDEQGTLRLRRRGEAPQLAKVDFDHAMTVALLASVSSELTVSEYNSAKAEGLEALAKSFQLDTAAIRRQVGEEVADKRRGRGWEGRAETEPA